MSRRKGKHQLGKNLAQSSAALLRNGLNAFRQADYDRAVDAWERVSEQTPERSPVAALAEALFRRGLRRLYDRVPELEAGLADLQRAADLMPSDPCHAYHLGLAAHRQGKVGLAVRCYQAARREGTAFVERAAYPLALALLQRGDDPSAHAVWSALTDQERAMLSQASAFRRRPYVLSSDAPALWHGMVALDSGSSERARSLFEQTLQRPATAVEEGVAHYYLGVLAAQSEDWEEAGRQWNAARIAGLGSDRLKANLGEAYHRLAEERLQDEDVEGALAAALEARRHKPGDGRLSDLIAHAYQRQADRFVSAGDWGQALECWQKAQELAGGSFRLAYNLALAYERAEDFVAAGETWREALRRRPRRTDHPDAISDEQVARLWRRAAEAYQKAGEYEEAVNVYRQALKWNPDDLQARLALAEGLLDDGRLVAAQNELERLLERDPDNVRALLRMGEVIAESEYWWDQSSAPHYWKRVLELDPNNGSARQSLADFYQDRAENLVDWGRHDSAIDVLKQALEYQPKSGRLLAALGDCYLGLDELETAAPLFEQALAQGPRDLSVYNAVIHAWVDEEDVERAQEIMARAEAAVADMPYAFYISQAAYCIESDLDDLARSWLERAIEKAPPGEPVLAMIGEMAVMSNAPTIAREYLERAIKLGQASGQVYLLLGLLSAITENDLKTADKHWRQAERIAHREDDPELSDRVELARALFSGPAGLFSLLSRGPFFPRDMDMDDVLFDDWFDEEDDDDDF